ncbi:hypothetical protein O3M35_012140 [Rhynocoris fuscipes]|uniref:Exophilin 5 n=1 Tax=Rhynocoris fuscipes TaxID=488301 RepID=A0AAW1CUI7_9HEMI
MPSSRREPVLFNNLKKESISPSILRKNHNFSGNGGISGSDADRLNVTTKSKHRDPSPSMNNYSSTNKDIKFSKYSPLPAIKSRPSLLREKTYDVLEPVFVKGPIQDVTIADPLPSPVESRIKLPEIRTNRIQTSKVKKTTQEIHISSISTPNKKENVKTPAQPQSAANITGSFRQKMGKLKQPFNPNHVSKASMPESPTVFWFPV